MKHDATTHRSAHGPPDRNQLKEARYLVLDVAPSVTTLQIAPVSIRRVPFNLHVDILPKAEKLVEQPDLIYPGHFELEADTWRVCGRHEERFEFYISLAQLC